MKNDRVFDYAGLEPLLRDIVLSSIMLFPEAEEERTKYMIKLFLTIAAVQEQKAHEAESTSSFQVVQKQIGIFFADCIAGLGGWQNVAQTLLVGQQHDFQSAVLTRMRSGMLAGWILDLALAEKSSIQKATTSYCEVFQEGNGHIEKFYDYPKSATFNVTEENIANNIWPDYQNVAHLWAACSHFKSTQDRLGSMFYHCFDCFEPNSSMDIPAGYEGFCLVAEKYREQGVKFKPSRSTKPLLSNENCWRVTPPPSPYQFAD